MNEEPIVINKAGGRTAPKTGIALRAACLMMAVCLLLQADAAVAQVSAAEKNTVTFSEGITAPCMHADIQRDDGAQGGDAFRK